MLNFLNQITKGRTAWFLAGLIALILEIVALYMQHIMMLKPCVLCIYERCALFGIIIAGFLGSAIQCIRAKWLLLLLWFYSAYKGLAFAIEHRAFELNTNPFAVCRVGDAFPSWLPLDQWLPEIFLATTSCGKNVWSFLNFSMPQWLIMIFSLYFISAIFILIGLSLKLKIANS